MFSKITNYIQAYSKECVPTGVKIIAKYYGKTINIQELKDYSETTRDGSKLLKISVANARFGLRTIGIKASLKKLEDALLHCILHWNKKSLCSAA